MARKLKSKVEAKEVKKEVKPLEEVKPGIKPVAVKEEVKKEPVKEPVALNRYVLVSEVKDGVERFYIHDPKGRRISSDSDNLSFDNAKKMVEEWNRGAGYPA